MCPMPSCTARHPYAPIVSGTVHVGDNQYPTQPANPDIRPAGRTYVDTGDRDEHGNPILLTPISGQKIVLYLIVPVTPDACTCL